MTDQEAADIASHYPTVKKDGVPFLEKCCAILSGKYPDYMWEVEVSKFGVPPEEQEYAIFPWGPTGVLVRTWLRKK